MPISGRCYDRVMSHRQHLPAPTLLPQQARHGHRRLAPDVRVDLVEDHKPFEAASSE
jgi:hypothetical protein